MFAKALILGLACLPSWAINVPSTQERRGYPLVGYLGAFFYGHDPYVYLYTSLNSDPTNFTVLNDGDPVIVPTLGTGGVRDPTIVRGRGTDLGSYWLLGTDLDISKTNWDDADRIGSRAMFIWQSDDLVTWSDERLVTMENETAGMVYAPDAIWDGDKSVYHSNSESFNEDDLDHEGRSTSYTIRYSYTTDFETFTDPQDWFGGGRLDANLLQLDGSSYARFYKNQSASQIYQQISANGLLGDWSEGTAVMDDNTEGPYAFWDNVESNKAHLLLDYYSGGTGYVDFDSDSVEDGVWERNEDSSIPTGLRHGSVLAINQGDLTALQRAYL
ncbi:hypothetical protein PFICI_02366 [Pestalotiopsis fici W106-1]|uniref:Glycosyl hydrolase family 32 N-terminal domain-containing protein n=1 Tax=Pestalotiopsis fici (strain W106-1 / CGMCC3.15140) TaxID=1229662 RepID=W3XGL2_PESFW|nr:uncharacterized protein PFICI_02366 [Pestalotiopsis fici W106-1]ETS84341.1 hypothetical protein PFICI_02366 [Pestalotiopsis fici W106-1]